MEIIILISLIMCVDAMLRMPQDVLLVTPCMKMINKSEEHRREWKNAQELGAKAKLGYCKEGRETLQRLSWFWAQNSVHHAICMVKRKTRKKYVQLCPSILWLCTAKKKKRFSGGVKCRPFDKDFVLRNEILKLVQWLAINMHSPNKQ